MAEVVAFALAADAELDDEAFTDAGADGEAAAAAELDAATEGSTLVAFEPVEDLGMVRCAMSSAQNPPDSSRAQTAFRSGDRT